METKDYNLLMQEMLKYSQLGGLNINSNYSPLYYKLEAMRDWAQGLYAQGHLPLKYTTESGYDQKVTMEQLVTYLESCMTSAKSDDNWKLESDKAFILNQFAKQTGFKYTPKKSEDLDISEILKSMQYLAGPATNLY
jgi:hypothetical protein